MFVFKAAVVGAGTMGGEIAQTIANVDIPVVLKDVKQEFVDAGLEKARRSLWQLARLVDKEKMTAEQGLEATRSSAASRHDELRRASATSTSSSRPCRSGWRSSSRSSRSSTRSPRPRDPRLQHLVALDLGDRRRHLAPRQGRRLPLLLPGVGHAADRGRRGRGHLAGHGQTARQLRPGDPQAADRLRARSRASSSTGSSTRAISEIWRAQEEQGLSIKQIDDAVRRRERHADAAVLPHRPARPRHRLPRRRAPAGVLRRPLLRPQGHGQARRRRASSAPRRAARASTRTASRTSRATPSPTARSSPRCSR